MRIEYRERLRRYAAETEDAEYGQMLTELLDETEPQDGQWRVSHNGIIAHYLADNVNPVCEYRDGAGGWRVVTNATPCSACKAIVQSGVLT